MVGKKQKAVLIADDQQELREMLAEKLSSLGKDVISFSNGQRLLGHLAAKPTDVELVVLDFDFGVGQPNGLEVLKEIKSTGPSCRLLSSRARGAST